MSHAALVRPDQEVEQHDMRLALHHAVKIDAGFERQATAGELALDRFFQRMVSWRRRLLFRLAGLGGLVRRNAGFFLRGSFRRRRRFKILEGHEVFELAGQSAGRAGNLAPQDALLGVQLAILRHQRNLAAAAFGIRI